MDGAKLNMSNTFEDYSELITTIARFQRKRDEGRHSHSGWRTVTEALEMLIKELVREQSFLEKNEQYKERRTDKDLADLLHSYNELNKEAVELDRRDVDVDLAGKIRKRPRRRE